MFNSEFYPINNNICDLMGIDCLNKIVLEPQAGKGDLVDYLKFNGAKNVLACETNADLRLILQNKCNIIANDFFDVKREDISHIHMIIMNPPFSNADKHILHAWQIAPEGCEIISLCNYETVSSSHYFDSRKELSRLIENYGDYISLGNCFDDAERRTNTEIGLVRLFKPAVSAGFDFDGFYYETENMAQNGSIMPYNEIRAIVNKYVASLACFDRFKEISAEMSNLTKEVCSGSVFSVNVNYNDRITTKEDFAKGLQIKWWTYIFHKMDLEKYVTSGVMSDINKFINSRKNYPFTMKNIYRMFEIIVGTREQTMNRAIEEAIDNMTRHTHENRYNVEGWKTNAGHLLNEKFIINGFVVPDWSSGMRLSNYSQPTQLKDLIKAICYITGKNYSDITTMEKFFDLMKGRLETNKWYSCGFFEFKFFKKGTGHFKFQNKKDWETLNKAYAKIKGQVLPEA